MRRAREAEHVASRALYGANVRVVVTPGTRPEAVPLLLCNGIGARLELLDPFVDSLDPSIDVVRFDSPGIGGSERARALYTFSQLAWALSEMMNELGHHRFDVLGISWGGAVAQQLAFQHRGRVRRLVLAATGTGSLMVPGHPRVLAKMLTPRRYRDPDYAAKIAAELYGGKIRDNPELARKILHREGPRGTRAGYLYQLIAGMGWTSLPVLPAINQPTLILMGRADPIIPLANGTIMRSLIPRARLHVYDDGHLGLVTQALTLGPLVSDFLLSPTTSQVCG
ncbi:poly(3-hydroxyalkanoate) depolymerase [Nocardioides sp. Root140]|uniref:poly(3-hydroxyalkanoate) depolymerase n=1 Tax=Nocardioides sp. Root140 TaxID=1736460 RepID=UPI0006F356D6|nr:poly(3-hydroxyalkanoate) depolymerase [Nocardioides sp. Root140]KQY57637.1 poly(3-hydroxyalkanoate) depolymerase [Nocardioides sp. Root140]KRF14094.1 poly(3-hydroxyalkanoate) depolymerase [Nocardioides sp. Soil797]